MHIKGVIALKVANRFNAMGYLEKIIYPDQTEYDLNPDEYGQPITIGKGISNISYHPNGHWQQMRLGVTPISSSLDSYNRVNQYNYGTLRLNYNYDANNNLSQMSLSDSAELSYQHQYNFAYDKMGRISSAKLSNGEVVYSYDENDNLLAIKSTLIGSKINSTKNSTSTSNSLSPTMTNNIMFSYDNMRLTGVSGAGGEHAANHNKITYGYDDVGNIKTDSYSRYNYGLDGNLQSMSGKHYGTYEYDYNQQRVYQENKSIYGNERIVTFYNKAGLALYDYNLTTQKTNKYLYLNGQRLSKVTSDIKEAKVQNNIGSYYYNDAQGSPLAEVNEQGQTLWREAYLPFGAKLLNDIDITVNKFGFVGKEMDESGLSYFGARYYNPISGRFMAPDPVEVKPEIPATFNRYAYAANNPYKFVDSDGRYYNFIAVVFAEFLLGAIPGAYSGWKDAGYEGALIGGFFGGLGSIGGSYLSGKVVSALAVRSLVTQQAAAFGAEVSTNAAASVVSSKINTDKMELGEAFKGATFGAISSSWVYRYGAFTVKTAAEAFGLGKYAATGSFIMETTYDKVSKNNLTSESKSPHKATGKIERR